MPFNGSGTFNRLYSWVVDAANSVNISSSRTDAEMNGFAAGLTNCITRDGQSPPSADIPWGGKRLTNLGAAAAGGDALSRDTADARYVQAAGANVTGNLLLATNNMALQFTDASGTHPYIDCQNDNSLAFYATDNTGAAKLIWYALCRSSAAAPFILAVPTQGVTAATSDNSTLLATTAHVKANLTASLVSPAFTGTPTAPTAAAGTNTTQLATTAFVLANSATLASPAFTGTPTAPTAAIGTSTTQLATTAFVQAARAPSGQTIASAATVTPTFNDDFVEITAQAAALTLANPTGTAANMWGIAIRIKDNGTPQTIAFGTQYRGVGVALPTTTVAGKTLILGMIFNNALTKWDVVSAAQE